MILSFEGLLIFSEDARKLADFYKNIVGLKLLDEMVMGEDEEEVFMFGTGNHDSPTLTIMDHTKVKGVNKNPERMIFNLEVDNIIKETKRLTDGKAKLIQDIYHVENYGQIATFADSDGNYFQLVQTRAN